MTINFGKAELEPIFQDKLVCRIEFLGNIGIHFLNRVINLLLLLKKDRLDFQCVIFGEMF